MSCHQQQRPGSSRRSPGQKLSGRCPAWSQSLDPGRYSLGSPLSQLLEAGRPCRLAGATGSWPICRKYQCQTLAAKRQSRHCRPRCQTTRQNLIPRLPDTITTSSYAMPVTSMTCGGCSRRGSKSVPRQLSSRWQHRQKKPFRYEPSRICGHAKSGSYDAPALARVVAVAGIGGGLCDPGGALAIPRLDWPSGLNINDINY